MTKKKFTSITKEFLILNVQDLIVSQKVTPTFKEYEYKAHVIKEFDSWENFLKVVNQRIKASNTLVTSLEIKKLEVTNQASKEKKISKDFLIKDIQKKAKELGRTPLVREYQYKSYAIRYFETWSAFLHQAGLEMVTVGRPKKKISKEFLIEDIQNKATELGKIPELRTYQHKNTVVRHFGTWNAFLFQAGLKAVEPQQSKKQELKEFLITDIQNKTRQLGRIPAGKEFKHFYQAIKQFGTWNEFIKQANLFK